MTNQATLNVDQINHHCRSQTRLRELVHEVLLFERVESTNKIALEMAASGVPEGIAILAESQTEGKGRQGREWFSPSEKNIYLSLLLRPYLPIRDYPLFSLATAAGVIDGIQENTDLKCGIKWPNDIIYEDKKLGGILLETHISGGQAAALVIGIGLNVNLDEKDFPDNFRTCPSSLKIALGESVERTSLVMSLLDGVAEKILTLQGEVEEKKNVLNAVRLYCRTLDRKVRIDTPKNIFEGWAEAIEENGALRVRLGDQTRRSILLGDVTHLHDTHRDA